MQRDVVAAQELRLFAACEKRPVKRAQREKTVISPFGLACNDGLGERPGSVEQGGHREDVWEMVLENIDLETQSNVESAMDRALELWRLYRDEVAELCGIQR